MEVLRQAFSLSCVGLLSPKRKGLPPQFVSDRNRAEGDYMALFEEEEGSSVSIHSWITNTKAGEFTTTDMFTYFYDRVAGTRLFLMLIGQESPPFTVGLPVPNPVSLLLLTCSRSFTTVWQVPGSS
jgi:hypothetical protein